jgi:hypothetical protein
MPLQKEAMVSVVFLLDHTLQHGTCFFPIIWVINALVCHDSRGHRFPSPGQREGISFHHVHVPIPKIPPKKSMDL